MPGDSSQRAYGTVTRTPATPHGARLTATQTARRGGHRGHHATPQTRSARQSEAAASARHRRPWVRQPVQLLSDGDLSAPAQPPHTGPRRVPGWPRGPARPSLARVPEAARRTSTAGEGAAALTPPPAPGEHSGRQHLHIEAPPDGHSCGVRASPVSGRGGLSLKSEELTRDGWAGRKGVCSSTHLPHACLRPTAPLHCPPALGG